jgi:hypothetical protein
MKSTTISWWASAFLLIIFSIKTGATTFKEVDSLFRLKLYSEACISLERIIYENPGNESQKAEALLMKCQCFKLQNKYSLIDNLLRRCEINSLCDSTKARILFEQAFSSYMSENFVRAKDCILPLMNLNVSPEMEKASIFLYSFILNELSSWDESRNNLISFIRRVESENEILRDSLVSEVNGIYSSLNISKLRSINSARIMSLIVPGSGQAYAGDAGKGIISLSMIAFSGGIIYYNVINKVYSSAIVGLYLFSTFYAGNASQAQKLVKNRNFHSRNDNNDYLRVQLSSLYKKIV